MKSNKETLLGKYISGNASAEEEKEIIAWLKEHPGNEEELEQAKQIWNLARNLKKNNSNDTEKAWQDFKLITTAQPAHKIKRSKFYPLKIAASVALFILSFVVIKFFVLSSPTVNTSEEAEKKPIENKKVVPTTMITVSTTDSAKTFFLPDSSCIHLNKQSRFIYPEKFNESERATSLIGEAFFEIKRSPVAFVITCKRTKTLVLGTSFNIKGYEKDKKVIVSVVTGTVQLSDANTSNTNKITLKASERGTFDDEGSSISKTTYSDENFAWWK
ncbi:MAG: FecR family protein, partial [Bacteroidota bacterium]|nr:FecR family protein [Bacteroidota bacterium]